MKPSQHRYRDLSSIIPKTDGFFDYAYSKGVVTLYCRSIDRRSVQLEDGRQVVDFARGSYLGLDNHRSLVDSAISALQSYGSLQWSGARARLNFAMTRELEERLSKLFQCNALVFSLVLTANMGVLPLLACGAFTRERKPVLVFDRFCHATLAYHKATLAEDTEVITIEHNDMDALESLCKKHDQVAYIADGVYSMGGSAPIREMRALQEKYGLFLYIDDAHGVSIRGNNGEGYARSQFAELGEDTIIAASLSKGFGSTGAVVMLGVPRQEQLLRRYAVPHTFSMGPDLPAVAASLASANIHESPELAERQDRLTKVINAFDSCIETEDAGNNMPIRMVRIGEEVAAIDAAARVLDQGYYVVAAFFPTVPRGRAALRICLTADHTLEEVSGVCTAIRSAA